MITATADDDLRRLLRDLADLDTAARGDTDVDRLGRAVESRVALRRRRRRRRAGAAVAASAVLVGLLLQAPPGEVVTTEPADTTVGSAPIDPVAIEAIDVSLTDDGGHRIELLFAGPLPEAAAVSSIDEVPAGDLTGIAYATQDSGGVQVCGATHWFGSDYAGSVDVFVPSAWIDADSWGDVPIRWGEPDPSGADADRQWGWKVVACGPHASFVQVSDWGAGTDDPTDVTVNVSDDRTRVVVDVRP